MSEVLEWDDQTIATALEYLREMKDAAKDAAKGR